MSFIEELLFIVGLLFSILLSSPIELLDVAILFMGPPFIPSIGLLLFSNLLGEGKLLQSEN